MAMTYTEQRRRIKTELHQAGMTAYGQLKMGSRYLPAILSDDEHIGGVVYGRCARGLAMMVATNRRIIYIERAPMYSSTDEIEYSVISGVRRTKAVFSGIELHTRIGNYSLRFVNTHCANHFAEYVEVKVEHVELDDKKFITPQQRPLTIPVDAKQFIVGHEVAVLSTADRTGEVYGAAVYYVFEAGKFYMLTKSETIKAHNLIGHLQAALTIVDADIDATAQIHGVAQIETEDTVKQRMFERLVRPHTYGQDTLTPPVTYLEDGGFILFKLVPTMCRFTDYKNTIRLPHAKMSANA